MGDLAMFISSKAKPGKREEVFELYQEVLAPRALDNERQEVVVWAADQQDPDAFHLFEIYADGEALGANAQSGWFADYMAKVAPLLAGEPVVAMASPMWSKGL